MNVVSSFSKIMVFSFLCGASAGLFASCQNVMNDFPSGRLVRAEVERRVLYGDISTEKVRFEDHPFVRAALIANKERSAKFFPGKSSEDLNRLFVDELSATFGGKSPEELNVLFEDVGISKFRLLDLVLSYVYLPPREVFLSSQYFVALFLMARGAKTCELSPDHPFGSYRLLLHKHPVIGQFMKFCEDPEAFAADPLNTFQIFGSMVGHAKMVGAPELAQRLIKAGVVPELAQRLIKDDILS
jgi:hypothetical protein